MKITIFLLSVIIALTFGAPPPLHDDGKIHIPDKCEDVLAVKVCVNLEALAKRLKLKSEDVKKAIIDAVKQGKTSSIDIYNAAKDFLMKEVLTKKCEDFTSTENCQKLRRVAAVLKVNADKVEKFVIKAVSEGAVKAEDIYSKALEYYKAEIATKKCEDFLSNSQCASLRSIAAKLKIKADDLEDAIKDAYLKTLGDAKAMFQQVIATLKDYALNTKCEDLLNPDLCSALRDYAAITKVQFPVLMEKAVDLLVKGYSVSKKTLSKIFKLVDYLYDCEDVFDNSSCARLTKVAEFLGFAHKEVEEFVKKYVPIAVETGKSILNDIPKIMKELGMYLKDKWCKLTPLCFNADMQQDEVMFSSNSTSQIDSFKQALKLYIELRFPGLQDQVKQKVLEIINKSTNVAELVKEAVFEIIDTTGKAAEAVKLILKDLLANIKSIFKQSD